VRHQGAVSGDDISTDSRGEWCQQLAEQQKRDVHRLLGEAAAIGGIIAAVTLW
jgi:hypothetical protein